MNEVVRGTLATLTVAATMASYALSHVDILVAYDTTASAWLENDGRTAEAFAAEQVARMNVILVNSGLGDDFDVRLAGTYSGSATYDGADSFVNTLADLTESQDGAWKAYRKARETAGADLMMLFVNAGHSSGEIGLSNAMMPYVGTSESDLERKWGLSFDGADEWLSQYFSAQAFGVCDIAAGDGTDVFTHEVGHIMGAGHSEYMRVEAGPQLYTYSSAWMEQGSDGEYYASIMGYSTTGKAGSAYYHVQPLFSSPNVANLVTGEPLGDAEHDNVRTLRNTCAIVAGFMASKLSDDPEPPPVTPDPVTPVVPVVADAAFAKKIIVNGAWRDGDHTLGLVQFMVQPTKKGGSNVSATFMGLDGKKKKIKIGKLPVSGEGGLAKAVVRDALVPGVGVLNATIWSDGSITDATLGDLGVESAEIGAAQGKTLKFFLDEPLENIQGQPVLQVLESTDGKLFRLLPYEDAGEPVAVGANGKWSAVAKAGKIKKVKDRQTNEVSFVVDPGPDGSKSNFSALKVTFAAKTGALKGSFTANVLSGTKVVKYKFAFTGVAVDGVGIGIAECKKAGISIGVTIR